MAPTAVTLAILVVCTALLTAFSALLVMGAFRGATRPHDGDLFGTADETAVFLFDGPDLVDATDTARSLLASLPGAVRATGPAWPRLAAHLAPRFPTLEAEMATLARRGRLVLHDPGTQGDAALILRAEWRNGLARVALVDPGAEGARVVLDRLSHRAMEDELAILRATSDHAPFPVWRTAPHCPSEHGSELRPDGPPGNAGSGDVVVWANRAYLDLAERVGSTEAELGWPLPHLFDAAPVAGGRASVVGADGARHWFDLSQAQLDRGRLHFALPADASVKAETALRSFVQTLSRTFAHLPTGLAIFDSDRRLALFNPALPDLTGLPPDFLARRPTLGAVFDRLRDARMIPEPRNYKAWRDSLSDLEKAAASGQYQETWSLPGGQTYRVTGRPYTDGAVAFLFDDISGETSLARRFRSDLETGQAVLDTLDAGIAVFSAADVLVISNTAYARLWRVDPGATLGEVSLADATGHWMARGGPTGQWAGIRDAIADPSQTATLPLLLGDGTALRATVEPLPGGARLVRFEGVEAAARTGASRASGDGQEPIATGAGSPARTPVTETAAAPYTAPAVPPTRPARTGIVAVGDGRGAVPPTGPPGMAPPSSRPVATLGGAAAARGPDIGAPAPPDDRGTGS